MPDSIAVFVGAKEVALEFNTVDVLVCGDIFVGDILSKQFIIIYGLKEFSVLVECVGVTNEDGAVFSSDVKALEFGDMELTARMDETLSKMRKEHFGVGSVMFFVLTITERTNDGALVAAEDAFAARTRRAKFGGEAAVDWVSNKYVAGKHLFHVSGVIGGNELAEIAVVVFDVHVADFVIFFSVIRRELKISVLFYAFTSFIVDGEIMRIFFVFFAGKEVTVFVFDNFTFGVFGETVIGHTIAVHVHSAE